MATARTTDRLTDTKHEADGRDWLLSHGMYCTASDTLCTVRYFLLHYNACNSRCHQLPVSCIADDTSYSSSLQINTVKCTTNAMMTTFSMPQRYMTVANLGAMHAQ